MQIFVDLFGQRTVAAEIGAGTTFHDLKSTLLHNNSDNNNCNSALQNSRFLYFSYNGKPFLADETTNISSRGVSDHSILHLRVRVSGGGGDGGATGAESRDCYLNMYATKKPDKVDPNEARLAKWSRCALSSDVLKPPCVVDLLGNLYNKETLVSALITKSLPKDLRYIKGLKDVVTIQLTSVPGIDPDDDTSETKFQCPISGLEFNGKYKFYVLRSCGHVLSARALKEVQSSSCLVCFKPFVESDNIVINGTEEEVSALRKRMEEEKGVAAKLKDSKKEKKAKNGEVHEGCGVVENGGPNRRDGDEAVVGEFVKPNGVKGVKRKETKLEKASVVDKSKDQKSNQSTKKFKAVDIMPVNATKEVYASIFSSSSKSKIKETYMCRSLPLGRN